MKKKVAALQLRAGELPEVARRADIRTRIDDLLHEPLRGQLACRTCALFFPPDTVSNCPACDAPLIKMGDDTTRMTLILDSLTRAAIANPEGNAVRTLLAYGYGTPKPRETEVVDPTHKTMSEVIIRVIETKEDDAKHTLLEPKRKTA